MTDDARVERIVADVLGLDRAEVGEHTRFGEPAVWDSIAHLDIVQSLELELGVRLSTREITEILSVSAIKAMLRAKGALPV